MTTIITRVFADLSQAETAAYRLNLRGLPKRDHQIIVAGPKAEAQMRKAHVHEDTMASYAKHLANGAAVLVVHASYRPLGAATLTREVLAKLDTIDTGAVTDDFRIPWEPEANTSILKDHPLFLTIPGLEMPGRISEIFGLGLLKERKPKDNLMASDKRMSQKFWPRPLVSKKKKARSAISGGRFMSRAFWPMPLISNTPRRKSVIPGGGLPFSRRLGLKVLS